MLVAQSVLHSTEISAETIDVKHVDPKNKKNVKKRIFMKIIKSVKNVE